MTVCALGECTAEVPRGRRKYCSAEHVTVAVRLAAEARQERRRGLCSTCGKPKTPGKGNRYCATCREAAEDAFQSYERHRSRTRSTERSVQLTASGRRLNRRRPVGTTAEEGTKWCGLCEEDRPKDLFAKTKKGLNSYCKPCQTAYNHERRLETIYGLTFEQYDKMMIAQGNACAICQKKPRRMRLAVDHNHRTGQVRGLLCGRCNRRVLGGADESAERLRRAADYLDHPPAVAVIGEVFT